MAESRPKLANRQFRRRKQKRNSVGLYIPVFERNRSRHYALFTITTESVDVSSSKTLLLLPKCMHTELGQVKSEVSTDFNDVIQN